eukprot:SAG22_NODE_7977_length_693_cov_8.296296_2_plen_22_part_01
MIALNLGPEWNAKLNPPPPPGG